MSEEQAKKIEAIELVMGALQTKVEGMDKVQTHQKKNLADHGPRISQVEIKQNREEESKSSRSVVMYPFPGFFLLMFNFSKAP